MLLDAIFFVRILRLGLCPVFSSECKGTRQLAVAGGGLKKDGAVYAVSDRGPAADQIAESVIAIRSGWSWTKVGGGPPQRMA